MCQQDEGQYEATKATELQRLLTFSLRCRNLCGKMRELAPARRRHDAILEGTCLRAGSPAVADSAAGPTPEAPQYVATPY